MQAVSAIHLSPAINDALLKAFAAGKPVEMRMQANNEVPCVPLQ
jgi:hypothetical protein